MGPTGSTWSSLCQLNNIFDAEKRPAMALNVLISGLREAIERLGATQAK